jgi:hypothetical protein
MEFLLNFFDDLVTAGGVSKAWLTACLVIAAFGVFFYYAIKGVTAINSYLKSPEHTISKQEIESIKTAIQNENRAIFKILDDVRDRVKNLEVSGEQALELHRQLENEVQKIEGVVDEIKETQAEDIIASVGARRDLTALVQDSKAQYIEVARQVQGLQKDLASLQGTIIGMGTQRTRLK